MIKERVFWYNENKTGERMIPYRIVICHPIKGWSDDHGYVCGVVVRKTESGRS